MLLHRRHSNPRNSLNKSFATIKDKIKLSDLSQDHEAIHHMFIKKKTTGKRVIFPDELLL